MVRGEAAGVVARATVVLLLPGRGVVVVRAVVAVDAEPVSVSVPLVPVRVGRGSGLGVDEMPIIIIATTLTFSLQLTDKAHPW